jgi:heme exporter protein A
VAALDQVQIRKVGKRYGSERALAGVTLDLAAGSMCALLGHNGAGKTTLLGIVSTLVRPSGGTVEYRAQGGAVSGSDVRREIGLLAHSSLCYGELTARENLELFAGLYDGDGSAREIDERSESRGRGPAGSAGGEGAGPLSIDGLLDRVGLDAKARDRAARTYSRGMLQRLALARALLTRPSLLLLDEPFTGLDRDGALALGAELGALRDAGAIVVVVTHDLEAIAGRTDHVAILRRGQLVCEERGAYTYEQLKDLYHRHAN